MRRRDFIAGIGGAAAWPLAARAQNAAIPVIGVLHPQSPGPYEPMLSALRQGLIEAGFVEGRNILIEQRWAHGQVDRLPELAAELVRLQVAAIVVSGGAPPALAAKAATSTIPIVLAFGSDPVQLGLVASLNRPGNNITGFSFISTNSAPKRLQLLHDAIPRARTIGAFFDPQAQKTGEAHEMAALAGSHGWEFVLLETRSATDFENAFATLIERRAGGLVIISAPLFTNDRDKLLALAARHRMPAMYYLREYVQEGGLMSYGASVVETWRQAASYVGRILKGAKPSDLPFQLPTKFEFIINLATAKTLGLTIPQTLLATADQVIE
jgi:putative tryptophan/tyrosine transport system substrate-binding protein